jgi:uncharacterized membrane protein HdeD (DUF308 family)
MVFGALAAGLGVWLILSTNAKTATLAILLALSLFVLGLGELVFASGRPRPWVGYLLGAIFMVAALVTLLRPGKSLYFLAVFVGASMILTGVLQLALALFDRQDIEHWVVLAIIGVIGIVAGVLAIAWPDITIWVLGLVIGLRVLFFGILEMFVANQLRQLTS